MSMLLAALSGCADQQETLIVTGAPIWPAMQSSGCPIEANETATLTFGTLDFYCMGDTSRCFDPDDGVQHPHLAAESAGAGSNPTARTSGTDNSEVQLKEVDITFSSSQAPEVIDVLEGANPAFVDFTLPLAAQSIPAGMRVGLVVQAISPAMAAELYNAILASFGGVFTDVTIIASLVFHAERTGNTVGNIGDISSREFSFPINLCFGCLQSCSGCTGGECANTDLNTLTWTGGVCRNSQDGFIYPLVCGM